MNRLAMFMTIAAVVSVLLGAPTQAAAQDSFQSLLSGDVAAVEAKLQLSGDKKAQVDAILREGVSKRLAVLNSLGVQYGVKPSFGTLLKLRSDMDDIRTEQQAQLSKILSEQQMFVVEKLSQESEQRFRAVLLGS